MKLQELAAISPTKQAAKVFESYFGGRVDLDTITRAQARNLLSRVRGLVNEHRRTPAFHRSEQNPSYLKLVMMEQVLSARLKEGGGATVSVGSTAGADFNTRSSTEDMAPINPAVSMSKSAGAASGSAATQSVAAKQKAQREKAMSDMDPAQQTIMKKAQAGQPLTPQEQAEVNKTMMAPQNESRLYRRLREASEIQQAQVVLASQDMVDQVQKMIEQVTSMQFKDLPALVDQIKNEVGVDQSAQFNNDANAALGGLVQNLQGSKQQLEAALGVVTGQAPTIPGQDMAPAMPPAEEIPAELPAPEPEMDADLEVPKASLGRGRR